jgi:hypothetical protein
MATLGADRVVHTDLKLEPGQMVLINGDRDLPAPPAWSRSSQQPTNAMPVRIDSCQYASDGECDVPQYCDAGTDDTDCGTTSGRGASDESAASFIVGETASLSLSYLRVPSPAAASCAQSNFAQYSQTRKH